MVWKIDAHLKEILIGNWTKREYKHITLSGYQTFIEGCGFIILFVVVVGTKLSYLNRNV